MSADLHHDYAEVNGVTLHYVSAGTGDLILFLHGFPEFWYAWKDQLIEFSKGHRAVAVDQRGYNLSSKPDSVEAYALLALMEDTRAFIRHLGYERCILVAHDWGGALAWTFAAAYPEMVSKLVILNAPHIGVFSRLLREDAEQQQASQYMLFFRSPLAEAGLTGNNHEMLVRIVLSKGLEQGYFTEADKRAYLEAWSQPGAITGGLNWYRAARIGPPQEGDPPATELPASMLEVKVPTWVIWGDQDTAITLKNVDGLSQYVKQLAVRHIPDAGHWLVHEKPALVNQYLREALAAS